ncbi:dipeptidyl peptidase 2-like [Octopus vulgaris]|uniref:Dipeptidyl peptidase 2-like n=1 Tax=Octopus vulgaris TaxID=6645 RepID=A0AA36BRN1_OCTVU|nr:dipeptidyl peptidase 2-like [Octopus vulgaris]
MAFSWRITGLIWVSLLLILLNGPIGSSADGNNGHNVRQSVPFTEKYMEQYVDHINFVNNKTFFQRYLVQDKWWDRKNNGPIFFYTGNEGPIDQFWEITGLIFNLAPKFGALVVFGEHRYYGKSLPFGPDQSFKQPYISFLTVRQALADFAHLINTLKIMLSAQKSPVISFGGSYGGMLTAYLRMKYPGVCDGGIAASAPIYLFDPKFDHSFFFTDVSKDFSSCEPQVRQAFIKMNQLMAQGETGKKTLEEYFKLCKPISGPETYTRLLGAIRNAFTNMAMFDYPYATPMLPIGNPVNKSCQMMQEASDVLKGLVDVTMMFYNASSKPFQCFDVEKAFIPCADPTGCGVGPASVAWDFQLCGDLAPPTGTNNVTDMFPVLPFNDKIRDYYCQKVWNTVPTYDWEYWGQDLKTTSNIVFSNGDLDPWHRGGVLKSVSPSVVAFMVKGGAHHFDLRGPHPKDSASVIEVRAKEEEMIKKWVAAKKMLN